MNQKQYKIIVAYDGTGYFGWIQQPNKTSIVQTLQDAFEHVFVQKIRLLGASKTDAGVHAMGQVAVFKTDLQIDPDKMKWAWNNALPESITIRWLSEDNTFHPHHNVIDKTYYYHIFLQRPLPFWGRYGMQVQGKVDWKLFEQALKLFEGTHNFRAFYTGNDRKDTVRTIKKIHLEYIKRYNVYRISVVGETFLRHMVRRIVGAALAATQRESITLDDVKHALDSEMINYELPTAPAKGLMLYCITYEDAR